MLLTPHTVPLPSGLTFDLIEVEGGPFLMGSPDGDKEAYDDEKPQHEVQAPGFLLGKYPVTQALWLTVMGERNPSGFRGDEHPVENVSWFDAVVFCNRLSELCGRRPRYYADAAYTAVYGKKGRDAWELPNAGRVCIDAYATGYRLPTEAEWEYAARGGRHSEGYRYAGSDKLKEVGWYDENSGSRTHPVGELYPNELGLYDMSGNVYEWCEDTWHDNYKGAPADGSAWVDGEKGVYRVSRGGGWIDFALSCRVSLRNDNGPALRYSYVGFRLGLSLQFTQ